MQPIRRHSLTQAGRACSARREFEAVGVAEVMRAAGLTHGGFYGHFASKDDLFAQTVVHLFAQADPADDSLSDETLMEAKA